jgi:hypothetical protein
MKRVVIAEGGNDSCEISTIASSYIYTTSILIIVIFTVDIEQFPGSMRKSQRRALVVEPP